MSSKLQPALLAVVMSALLGAGSALAAPTTSDADAVRATRELKQRVNAAQPAKALPTDKVRHEMVLSGPHQKAPAGRSSQRDGVRPASQDKYRQGQAAAPRWSETRREVPMPSRQHYQPDARDQRMSPVAPVRSDNDSGRQIRSQRDRAPMAPEQWKQTRGDDVPFSYHR